MWGTSPLKMMNPENRDSGRVGFHEQLWRGAGEWG